MQIAANTTWFDFTISGGPPFAVYAFTGKEEVSTPFVFSIELVSLSPFEDIVGLVGKEACLSIADRTGERRRVHGVIRQMDQLHTANARTHYRCLLVPRLWFLSRNCNHRIFQHQSVVDIISKVLEEQGFTGDAFSFKCFGKYQPREYCLQYGESDFHFINRLCEEEGIYYYFEHSDGGHCLCFSDMAGGPPIPGESLLRFYPGSGKRSDSAVIARLNLHHTVNSDAATYREWNFEKPSLNLEVADSEPDARKAPSPGGVRMETYQFPHLYQLKDPGMRYAGVQLLRQLSFSTWIDGESDVSRFTPGFTFVVHQHQRPDVNASWWVTAVEHKGEQPGVLEHEAPSERGQEYNAHFTAIPAATRYVPPVRHPKVRVDGLQSAIVTGPSGEEVYCDKYGRVKVQFHWDREGARDEKTTCWVRVADTWAGENFGFIQLPRIGQEVLVEYMEGDPDRPVITGRVYNAHKMPPYDLPSQKTLSGIQSREFQADRKNQLLLDDTKGEIQAQISSDHNLSQLNLGYLTRIDHVSGRKDFRGEGFELRTDGWGVVRAQNGLLITTDKREHACSYHKDMGEALGQLQGAATQQNTQLQSAVMHSAQGALDQESAEKSIAKQNKEIKGSGEPHGELSHSHMVISGAAGIAATTPGPVHINAGKMLHLTAGDTTTLAGAKSILMMAKEKISLFAHKMGIKIFSAQGKVEIQAQYNDLDIIADKIIRLITAKETISLVSPKKIELNAGGSYIILSKNGIEMGTEKKFEVHAASHSLADKKSMGTDDCPLPSGIINDEQFVALDKEGKPFPGVRYRIVELDNESSVLAEGVTDIQGRTSRVYTIQPKAIKVVWDLKGA